VSSLSGAREHLDYAWKGLCNHWEQTREVWQDGVAEQFTEEFVEPLERHVLATREQLAQLDRLLITLSRTIQ
jgi:hypothetical protein